MAAGGGERRGAAPREEGTEGVVFWRPPRPPPRALALAAARVDAAGGEYPSVGPVPPLLPASAPRPPMSQLPWYRPLEAAQWRDAAAPTGNPAHGKRRARSGEERLGASGREDLRRGGLSFCLFAADRGTA